MNAKDRKALQLIIADEIMSEPGKLARVNIRRNYSSDRPFEDVSVWFALADGSEHEKVIHLTHETIYSTPWKELAKRVSRHLEL